MSLLSVAALRLHISPSSLWLRRTLSRCVSGKSNCELRWEAISVYFALCISSLIGFLAQNFAEGLFHNKLVCVCGCHLLLLLHATAYFSLQRIHKLPLMCSLIAYLSSCACVVCFSAPSKLRWRHSAVSKIEYIWMTLKDSHIDLINFIIRAIFERFGLETSSDTSSDYEMKKILITYGWKYFWDELPAFHNFLLN